MSGGSTDDDDPSTWEDVEVYRETVAYHNRDFQKYAIENGAYFAPVDDDEIERLQEQHDALQTLFDGRLIFAPLTSPRKILDCGVGTGQWAMEVLQQNPGVEVDGVDIYPYWFLPGYRSPQGFSPSIDDLNQSFTWRRNTFDIVHSQMICGGIHKDRWRRYIRDIYRCLTPGGWCHMVEVYFNAQSDNGSLTDGHALRRWSSRYISAMSRYKDPRAGMRLKDWMEHAGFERIEHRQMQFPMNGWSSDQRLRAAGEANNGNVRKLLSSLAVYPFTEILGMTLQDVHLLVAQARREADNAALRPYFPIYVCIGQKPR